MSLPKNYNSSKKKLQDEALDKALNDIVTNLNSQMILDGQEVQSASLSKEVPKCISVEDTVGGFPSVSANHTTESEPVTTPRSDEKKEEHSECPAQEEGEGTLVRGRTPRNGGSDLLTDGDLLKGSDSLTESVKDDSPKTGKQDSEHPVHSKKEEQGRSGRSGHSKPTELSLDFPTPAHIIAFFDPEVYDGVITLHPWQYKISSEIGSSNASCEHPYCAAICAVNGSGKDRFVISPFIIWFLLTRHHATCVCTSASALQLKQQTERYVRRLALRVNAFFENQEIFEVKQRYIKCSLTNSEAYLFATDEEGKAEGYHPEESQSELAVIINESKSIEPTIFEALERCTGYSYWIEVSSPGCPSGHFYDSCKDKSFRFWKVTAADCPHIPESVKSRIVSRYGRFSAIARSMLDADFTSVDGSVVITSENISKLKTLAPRPNLDLTPVRAGLDISAGGDEQVLDVWKGNKEIALEAFHFSDTTVLVDFCITLFQKYNLKAENIYADDGGLGRSVIDQFWRKGWEINRVLNQASAIDKAIFLNRGAEMWWLVARLIQECLILPNLQDELLVEQLTNRYYAQKAGGKIQLQSKADAKLAGHPSPDRGDALVLSFGGLTLDDFLSTNGGKEAAEQDVPKVNPKSKFRPTQKDILKFQRSKQSEGNWILSPQEGPYDMFNSEVEQRRSRGFCHGSLSAILKALR